MGEAAAGEVINGYRVIAALGRGGLGTTFEAVREVTGEHVALKRLAVADVADWKRFELFEREARVLASLDHPAIPRYLDHFMVEGARGPTLYVVQAVVRGQSLAEMVMTGGALDESKVRQIANELLMVLAYLGQRNPPVVHRDIKPENVMRRTEGPIALVDFGAARADHAKPAGGSTTVGTYGYMAPEQLHGVAVPATDIYGLACTMLFLLSGRSPTELPRQKLAIDFKPHVRMTPSLAAWLEKALAPAPEDRFTSADAALSALRTGNFAGGSAARKHRTTTTTLVLAGILGATAVGAAGIVSVMLVRDRRAAQLTRTTAAPKQPPLLPARAPTLVRPPSVRMTRRFEAHLSAVFAVAVSPDGKQVASGGGDGSVKIWDFDSGEPVRALPGQAGRVPSVHWSRDGSMVISGGGRGVILQDAKTGAIRLSLALPGAEPVSSMAVSPDEKWIVATALGGSVRGFNAETGATTFEAVQPMRLLHVSISPDGSRFATAQNDGTIGLWSSATGKLTATRSGHVGPVDQIAWSPDGRALFSVGDDRTLRSWFVDRPDSMATATDAADEVWAVATEPRGKYLATASKDGFLRIYDAMYLRYKSMVDVTGDFAKTGARQALPAVAFAPDGNHLVVGTAGGLLTSFALDGTARPERVPVLPANTPDDRPPKTRAHRVYAQTLSAVDRIEADDAAYDTVGATLATAIEADPKNALNHVALASLHRRRDHQGDRNKKVRSPLAASELAKAFELAPQLPEAFLERAFLAHDEEDDLSAKVDVLMAEHLGGPTASVLGLLGELSFAEGKVEEAEAHARKGMTLAARSQAKHLYKVLQSVYWRQGDVGAYQRAYELEIESAPWSAWSKGNYADRLIILGELEKAIVVGKQAAAQRNYGMVHHTLANAYAEKGAVDLWTEGDLVAARASFDNALVEEPANALAHYGLGACYRRVAIEDHDSKAVGLSSREYELALRGDPNMEIATKARQENAELARYLGETPLKRR